eukprot:COSAG02_NODE_2312_length_9165_cov_13.956872_8_plen_130_part_00
MTTLCGGWHCSIWWIWLTELYSRLVNPAPSRTEIPERHTNGATEAHTERTEGDASSGVKFVSFVFKRQAPLGLVFGEIDAALCWEVEGNFPTSQHADHSSRGRATVVSLVRHGSEADELGVRPGTTCIE